jgi:hypothetical protein
MYISQNPTHFMLHSESAGDTQQNSSIAITAPHLMSSEDKIEGRTDMDQFQIVVMRNCLGSFEDDPSKL